MQHALYDSDLTQAGRCCKTKVALPCAHPGLQLLHSLFRRRTALWLRNKAIQDAVGTRPHFHHTRHPPMSIGKTPSLDTCVFRHRLRGSLGPGPPRFFRLCRACTLHQSEHFRSSFLATRLSIAPTAFHRGSVPHKPALLGARIVIQYLGGKSCSLCEQPP